MVWFSILEETLGCLSFLLSSLCFYCSAFQPRKTKKTKLKKGKSIDWNEQSVSLSARSSQNDFLQEKTCCLVSFY